MKKETLFIENRDGLRMAVRLIRPQDPVGLVFMVHGMTGYKEQPHMLIMEDWKKIGYWERASRSRGGVLKVPYALVEDLLCYDFAAEAHKITARTIFIHGDGEAELRIADNRELFDRMVGDKDLIVLSDTPHNPADTPENAVQFREVFKKCLSV